MPKTKLGEKYAPKPRINYWQALIKAAERARNMTSLDLGRALGVHDVTIRRKTNYSPSRWTVEDILLYCKALEIDPQEAWEAILKSV